MTRFGRPILIAAHPRSGTHLMIDFLRRNVPATRSWRLWGLPLDRLYLNVERLAADQRRFNDRIGRRIVQRPKRPLLKTHYMADYSASWRSDESGEIPEWGRNLIDAAVKIYVVRDPRDVMVSYRQFLATIDSAAQCGLGEFVRQEHWTGDRSRLRWWRDHVEGWLSRASLIVRYEDLVQSPEEALVALTAAIDEKSAPRSQLLPPKVVTISKTRRDRILRLAPSSTAIIADRKIFANASWQDELTEEDHVYVDKEVGKIMNRFGYMFKSKDRGS